MSDEDVINKFVGDKFEADGSFQCVDPRKAEWFPPAGMNLRLRKVGTGSTLGAKIGLVLAPNTSFQGKRAIEAATYIVKGDKLINARPLVLQPGLTADEVLEMGTDPKTGGPAMLHKVKFSDNVEGQWTCPDKS